MTPRIRLTLIGIALLALAGCSTNAERFGGAGSGAIVGGAIAGPAGVVVGGVAGAIAGPTVANRMGIPHRRHWRRHRRYYPS